MLRDRAAGQLAFSLDDTLAAFVGDAIQLWHVPNAQVRATPRASVTSPNGTHFLLTPLTILRFSSARGSIIQPQ
jgi:hypothetical protein